MPKKGKSPTDEGPPLNTYEVARKLGVCQKTVRNYIEAGRLSAWRLGPGGPFRISQSQLTRFMDTLPKLERTR